jgi:hypothetical protein
VTLPFNNTEEAEAFGAIATVYQIILISEERWRLSEMFNECHDLNRQISLATQIQLCRECISTFKHLYLTTFAYAEQSITAESGI